MRPINLKSAARQVADHLRAEIQRLDLSGGMPGPRTLGQQLGVNHKTVEAALDLLQEEGLLLTQGRGRRRKIQPQVEAAPVALRIQMLVHAKRDNTSPMLVEMRHRLREAGHSVSIAERKIGDYSTNAQQFMAWTAEARTDAWLVQAAPRELLEQLAQGPVPVFAISGGRHGLPVAGCGPDKAPAMKEAVERLVALGHRNIAMLARKERLEASSPDDFESAFLNELERHGLPSGKHHLPIWNNKPSGYQRCLQGLMRQPHPTALLVDEAPLCFAAMQFLSQVGLSAPRNMSIVCMQRDTYFEWCRPSIAYFEWDTAPMIRRVLQWAHHVACGKPDQKQSSIATSYVDGDTVGPLPGRIEV